LTKFCRGEGRDISKEIHTERKGTRNHDMSRARSYCGFDDPEF
jgi:hypothetical protein